MHTLYYAKGTIAVAVAIALEEAGLPYKPVSLDFACAEQTRADYLSVNPKGRVPALVTRSGTVLTETGAILDYIAAIAPDAQLMPHNAEAAAHVRSVMYYLASTMHVAHAHKLRGARWADLDTSHADMTAKVPQTMAACAAYAATDCLRGDFVAGSDLTVADPYLFAVCRWLEGDGVPPADYPPLAGFLARMAHRDSVRAIQTKGIL